MFFSSSSSEKRGKEVLKNLYYFSENQMLDCNQYCIIDQETDEIALFDPGNSLSFKSLLEGMKKQNINYNNITKVFLTHEHIDHVIGLYPLMEIMKDEPPELFAYGETVKILSKGDKSQICPGNLGISPSIFGVKIVPLKINDLTNLKEITVFSDFIFQIHYTPGHSLGSISYYESSKKILIPGDLVFTGGSFGRYDFPGGSLKTLQNSIKFVNDLDVKYLLPGHMGVSNDGNRQIEFSLRMVLSIGSQIF
jgi:glyoxylase-like metal-dependent hydrolase (beta-lactamase superfamily II)